MSEPWGQSTRPTWPHDINGRPYGADERGHPIWPDEQSRLYWEDQRVRGFPAHSQPVPMGQYPTAPVRPRRDPKTTQARITAVVFLVIAGVVVWIITRPTSSSDKLDQRRDLAYEYCKDYVRAQLKSPSTASFPNYFAHNGSVDISGSGDGPFTVTGYVDSENSFGAKLRSDFTCTTEASGDTWTDDGTTVTGR